MLEWLKKKAVGSQLKQHFAALHEQFTFFKQLPDGLAERLANFVLSGEDQAALIDLAAHNSVAGQYIVLGNRLHEQHVTLLSSILDSLPQDPEVYLRLTRVYEEGRLFMSAIPAYRDTHAWLGTFLTMLGEVKSGQGFPASMAEAMVVSKGEDPSLLVRGPWLSSSAM